MQRSFSQTMSELRRARGLSQRTAAADLNISQALLSHYENGAREPGLGFVCRACEYYNVSADYMLGLVGEQTSEAVHIGTLKKLAADLRELTENAEKCLKEFE